MLGLEGSACMCSSVCACVCVWPEAWWSPFQPGDFLSTQPLRVAWLISRGAGCPACATHSSLEAQRRQSWASSSSLTHLPPPSTQLALSFSLTISDSIFLWCPLSPADTHTPSSSCSLGMLTHRHSSLQLWWPLCGTVFGVCHCVWPHIKLLHIWVNKFSCFYCTPAGLVKVFSLHHPQRAI